MSKLSIFWVSIAIGSVLLIIWVAMQTAWVSVQPGQEGVRLRDGEVTEVLQAGAHVYRPTSEEVVIYDTFIERMHRVPEAFVADGCPVAIVLMYSVGDVVAFHQAGGDYSSINALDAEVRAFASDRIITLQEPLGPVMAELDAHVQAMMPEGLEVHRVSADVGICGPQPLRIVQDLQPIAVDVAQGDLGAERAQPMAVLLVSGVDARIEIGGVVATYDIVDAEVLTRCFGNDPARAGDILRNIWQALLREAVGFADVDQLSDTLSELQSAEAEQLVDMSDRCGFAARALDYSAATVSRVISVNCNETPDAAACRP